MEQENKEMNPFDFLDPNATKDEADLQEMLETVEKYGERWLYAPLEEESIRLPMNDVQKMFLSALSTKRQVDGETIYTMQGKEFKIIANEKV